MTILKDIPNYSYETLSNPQSEEACYDELTDLFQDIVPEITPYTTDFSVGSTIDSFIRTAARVYKVGIDDTSNIIATQFVGQSAGEALTKVASGFFDEQRGLAIPTQGYMRLTLTDANSGPYTITSDDNTVIKYDADNTIQFYVRDSATIDSSHLVADVFVECLTSGTLGNVVVGSLLSCNDLSGISVSNPIYSGSTWVTQYGKDEENDASLERRATTKFSTFARGEVSSLFLTNAVLNATGSSGQPVVTYCSVDDNNPQGAGTVDVYIANDIDPVTTAQIETIQSGTLDTLFFGNNSSVAEPRVKALAATNLYIQNVFTSSIISYKGNFDDVRNNVETSLDTFVKQVPIGGFKYDGLSDQGILYGDIYETVLSQNNVTNCTINLDNNEEMLKLNKFDKLVLSGSVGERWTRDKNNVGNQPFSWKYVAQRK